MPPRNEPTQACLTDIGRRLVVEHMWLVPKWAGAAKLRRRAGELGIEFDELVAEGNLWLCEAALLWLQESVFATYATSFVPGELGKFLDEWTGHSRGHVDWDELFEHEKDEALRQQWLRPRGGHESWRKLPSTPEKICRIFDGFRNAPALSKALKQLSRRERRMVEAYLVREPRKTLAQVARDEELSYHKVIGIMIEAVRQLRETVGRRRKIERRKIEPLRPCPLAAWVLSPEHRCNALSN